MNENQLNKIKLELKQIKGILYGLWEYNDKASLNGFESVDDIELILSSILDTKD